MSIEACRSLYLYFNDRRTVVRHPLAADRGLGYLGDRRVGVVERLGRGHVGDRVVALGDHLWRDLDVDAEVARTFSLCIQSIGMGAASAVIILNRRLIVWRAVAVALP